MDRAKEKKRVWSFVRTIGILVACFVATILIVQMELEKRNERAAVESLPVFAQQSSTAIAGVTEDVAGRLRTAAQIIADDGQVQSQVAQSTLDALVENGPFIRTGVRLSDGQVRLNNGSVVDELALPQTRVIQGEMDYYLGQVQALTLDGQTMWTLDMAVPVPGTRDVLFGVVRLDQMFRHSFFPGLQGSDQNILVFETATGTILLDTLHSEGAVGQNFYEAGLLSQEQMDEIWAGKADQTDVVYQEQEGSRLYLCARNAQVPGWSLCVGGREETMSRAAGMGIPSSMAYSLLVILYGIGAVAVLLYQSVRERTMRDKLSQEMARNNSLINAALPSADVQVFEVLPDGMIRLLSPQQGQGQDMKVSLVTPRRLLTCYHCAIQWEAAFTAMLDQVVMGQESEIEVQTMDEEETWICLRAEPLPDNEETVAVGTIRDVTEEVKGRNRRIAVTKMADRMMDGTKVGMEVALEEDRWRILWGWDERPDIMEAEAQGLLYDQLMEKIIAPTVYPRDREEFLEKMDRTTLLGVFLGGNSRVIREYRVKTSQAPGYEWHACEIVCFREGVSRQVKCNFFVRMVSPARHQELEERRRLKEKEHALYLQARKLVESEDELDFVQVIADYYQTICAVNLNLDDARGIKLPDSFTPLLERTENRFSAALELYCQEQVSPQYREIFRSVVEYENLRGQLGRQRQVELTYQKTNGTWICLRIFTMPGHSPETPETLWVFEDDTDTVNLRQEEGKARVAAEAAEAASQAKSQFLANMSHDIRTPLNAILGMSELGLREEAAAEKDSCFRDIRGSGRILLENINSILDLSKIEAGKMDITPESYHILSVLHDVITVLRMRAQEKKLEFVAQVDETIPATLFGDDVNISHIIMNLGSNAIKYTNEGTVTLSVTWKPRAEDGSLLIHMADTGVGIRKEDMADIFRSYGRLDRKANRRIEGTGLGLPICKHLTEMMDGQIGLESTYGQGSDFWVRIPQKVIDPTPCGPYQGEIKKDRDQITNSFIAPEAVVLVVDDQPLNLKVCEGLMRPYEMEVHTARSGPEALRQMTQVWPDVVFMDHMMPDMDGMETTQRIREMGKKDPYFAVVPIVALTANAMKGMREYFLSNGFNDFVSKPIELDQLDDALKNWVPEDKQKAPAMPLGPQPQQPLPEELMDLKGIDVEQGMNYCGTPEIYQKTLFMFREQIPGRTRRIQEAWQEGKWDDYVIEVHSLKSAARWIGAMDLGDQAERLEMAGKARDLDQINERTDELLRNCRAFTEILAAVSDS